MGLYMKIPKSMPKIQFDKLSWTNVSREMKHQQNSHPFWYVLGSVLTPSRHFGCKRADSLCLRPSHERPFWYPSTGQRKHCDESRRILSKTPIAHLGVTELPLDHPKWMF